MEVKVTVTKGKAKRKEVTLPLPIIVGRSAESGLSIPHAVVSRQHCEIFEAGDEVRVRDLGSTNGTTVDGKRIAEVALQPQGYFEIGPYTFTVDFQAKPRAPAAQGARPAATPAPVEQDPELDADQCYRIADPAADPVAARRTLAEVRRRAAKATKDAAAPSAALAAIDDAELEDLDELLDGLKSLDLKEFLKGLE
jgi:pSer/pThr/pTyr-binding forkhead associated (FHA) protein